MLVLPPGSTSYNLPLGIDVASYQGVIDWPAVKADGVQFAITKATESTNYVNPTFDRNWRGMKDVGMNGMAYHYSRPSVNGNPTEEVYHFMNTVNNSGGLTKGDILCIDMEDPDTNQELSGWTLFQLEILENMCGFSPTLYTGKWYLDSRLHNRSDKFSRYPLWLASYNKDWPETPYPWAAISIWQFSDKAKINGIQGNVDLNYFNGPISRLPLLGLGSNTPPVVEPPTSPVILNPMVHADVEDLYTSTILELKAIEDKIVALQDSLTAKYAAFTEKYK
jgi:lysozyme